MPSSVEDEGRGSGSNAHESPPSTLLTITPPSPTAWRVLVSLWPIVFRLARVGTLTSRQVSPPSVDFMARPPLPTAITVEGSRRRKGLSAGRAVDMGVQLGTSALPVSSMRNSSERLLSWFCTRARVPLMNWACPRVPVRIGEPSAAQLPPPSWLLSTVPWAPKAYSALGPL